MQAGGSGAGCSAAVLCSHILPGLQAGQYRRVLFAATGALMSRETLENLGQPFYREDKARSRREGGAGLGVALCFEIARQHGARLQYFSRPGEGTLAIVEFEKA